jgi:hypothetical protein
MAINIIDGFYLGSSAPVDSRFVASDAASRNNMTYKYDGLKVFQTDTRETWIWNQGSSDWDLEGSSSTSGNGTANYIVSWKDSSTLGTSSIFATGSFVGINTTHPLASLQIGGTNQPIVIDNGGSGVVIGYNWSWNGSDNSFTPSVGSSKIVMDNSGGVSVLNRNPSGSFKNSLSLNNNGYNVLTSPSIGNFISGSVSFSASPTPYSGSDLVFVDGSFRTNSSFSKKVQYLYYNGASNPGIGSNYNVQPSDHELIIKSTNGVLFNVTLPSATPLNNGREIVVTLESTTQPLSAFVIQSSSNIVGLDGSNVNPVVRVGDTFILVSCSTFWKVIQESSQAKSYLINNGYILATTTGANVYETLNTTPILANTLLSNGDVLQIYSEFYCGLGYSGTNTNFQQLCDIRLNGVSFTQAFQSAPYFGFKFNDVNLQIFDWNISLTRINQTTAKFDISVETLKNFGNSNLSIPKFISGSFSSSKLTGTYNMTGIDFSTNMDLTFVGKTANSSVQQVTLNNVRVEYKNI